MVAPSTVVSVRQVSNSVSCSLVAARLSRSTRRTRRRTGTCRAVRQGAMTASGTLATISSESHPFAPGAVTARGYFIAVVAQGRVQWMALVILGVGACASLEVSR